MTNWTPHRVIIAVPASDRLLARRLWRFLDPDQGGEETFRQALYTRNGAPWLVACGQLEAELWTALRDQVASVVEAKVLLRRRRQRTAETLPKRTEIAALRSRMFVARVPPDMTPQQVLENAGFTEIPRAAGP